MRLDDRGSGSARSQPRREDSRPKTRDQPATRDQRPETTFPSSSAKKAKGCGTQLEQFLCVGEPAQQEGAWNGQARKESASRTEGSERCRLAVDSICRITGQSYRNTAAPAPGCNQARRSDYGESRKRYAEVAIDTQCVRRRRRVNASAASDSPSHERGHRRTRSNRRKDAHQHSLPEVVEETLTLAAGDRAPSISASTFQSPSRRHR